MEDFLPETIQAKRECVVFNVPKEKNQKTFNLEFYTQRNYLSKNQGQTKTFWDAQNQKEVITIRQTLQEMLK